MLTTAEKRQKLKDADRGRARDQMVMLNKIGKELGNIKGVNAMTDVTGFGLGGHLVEVAEGSGLSAELYFEKIPRITDLDEYISNNVFPDGTNRNWKSYGGKIEVSDQLPFHNAFTILADPQTNGGLLVTVAEDSIQQFQATLEQGGLKDFLQPIGRLIKSKPKAVYVV